MRLKFIMNNFKRPSFYLALLCSGVAGSYLIEGEWRGAIIAIVVSVLVVLSDVK